MNRTLVGWRTWYTRDLPNLGLFLCKGNTRVADMFETAWSQYKVRLLSIDGVQVVCKELCRAV
jgi:hypothetical protein